MWGGYRNLTVEERGDIETRKTVGPIGIRNLVLENGGGKDVKLHEEDDDATVITVTQSAKE